MEGHGVVGRPPIVSEYTRLKVERRGPVGWLIFDRPDAGNAMDATTFDELERAWGELDADPDVRVIVNTGEGRAFQTGVDVVQMAKDKDALREHARRTRDAKLRFTAWHCSVWKPVIAAVNGTCAGGGLHFVADADIVIAAADATFVDPHVSLGQVVAYEGIALARKSPMEPILRMALVGRHERVTAERARQLGILSEVVDPAEALRDRAQELAETIAKNSPAAMAATKRALWSALETGLADACRTGGQELAGMWGHPDQEEGPLAFTEKRDAMWAPIERTA
jgi:enoyl-CoA hydratase/carnithine racemase